MKRFLCILLSAALLLNGCASSRTSLMRTTREKVVRNDYRRAYRDYLRQVREHPTGYDLLNLGVLAYEAGDYPGAIRIFDHVHSSCDRNATIYERAMLHYYRSLARVAQYGQIDAATEGWAILAHIGVDSLSGDSKRNYYAFLQHYASALTSPTTGPDTTMGDSARVILLGETGLIEPFRVENMTTGAGNKDSAHTRVAGVILSDSAIGSKPLELAENVTTVMREDVWTAERTSWVTPPTMNPLCEPEVNGEENDAGDLIGTLLDAALYSSDDDHYESHYRDSHQDRDHDQPKDEPTKRGGERSHPTDNGASGAVSKPAPTHEKSKPQPQSTKQEPPRKEESKKDEKKDDDSDGNLAAAILFGVVTLVALVAGYGIYLLIKAAFSGGDSDMKNITTWDTLPDRIFMADLRVPPGPHEFQVTFNGANGTPLTLRGFPKMNVEKGQTVILRARCSK